jgi:hypothetical protein
VRNPTIFFVHLKFKPLLILEASYDVKMSAQKREWSKYCMENRVAHSAYNHLYEYPSCKAPNPLKQAPNPPKQAPQYEVIDFTGDSPARDSPAQDSLQSKALSTGNSSVQSPSAQRFQSYDRRSVPELVRQTSMQKARVTSGRSQSNNKLESTRTNVFLWLRKYRESEDDSFIKIQTDLQNLQKTIIPIRNTRFENLDDFVRNHLLQELTR